MLRYEAAYGLRDFSPVLIIPEGLALIRWIQEGRVQYLEEVLEGLGEAPDAIAGLYRGENLGKRLIHL